MDFPFYDPDKPRETEAAELPRLKRDKRKDAEKYSPDEGLVDAVNIALLLNKPLLVTGEPGTGKTLLAYNIAYQLGFDEPLVFETKSTSAARDLFYNYDSLTRFLSSPKDSVGIQSHDNPKGTDFITFNALGIALLRANKEEDVKSYLPSDFVHGGCRRSVVLIDEIDKAPRDFPNDLLNEVENMYFKIPELKNIRIAAAEDMFPILIITSNSEKHLPDAFLRRCIFYNIPFPNKVRLKEIVLAKIESFDDKSEMLADALDFFSVLRDSSNGLTKRPSTAELLEWLAVLKQKGVSASDSLSAHDDAMLTSLSSLVKNTEDQTKAKSLAENWLKSEKAKPVSAK